ncbi:hypothetical protein VTL71DRAFT_14517 [Oculimacula yallundae]|uniref:Uncharacterized protein n=1 Tax=Oculimacula yallundae TaxID=86028 RepID=A0ABR4CIV4_9HELO
MPPKKVTSKKELPKASSKSASKSTKLAPKAKAPKAAKTPKASKKAAGPAAAEPDTRRSTRANPSPGLKDRKSGIDKEPSFKKPTISRTALKNAAAARDNEAEESTQRESGSISHSSEPESRSTSPEVAPHTSTPPMPGAFATEEPYSHQAAGSSKAVRISKRTRSQVSDDASDADTEDASPSRPAKRVRIEARADDTPFEYANAFNPDPIQQQLALEIEAAPASPSNIHENVGEQLPASTPSNPSALAVINNDESAYYTPRKEEAAQATEVAEVVSAISVPEVIIHEPAVERHEPEIVAGDQSLAMTTTTPSQPSVHGTASTSKSASKSTPKSASRSAPRSASRSVVKSSSKSSSKPGYMSGPLALSRSPETLAQDLSRTRGGRIRKPIASSRSYFSARKGKTPERIHISDMSSSDEEVAPYTVSDMRFVKENSKRMLNIIQSEKLHKESMFVLRPDLQARLEKKFPRKRGDVSPAARHHNPGVLTPQEALEGVLTAGAAKKALKLAPHASPTVGNRQLLLSAGPSSQSLPVTDAAALPTAPNTNNALAPSQQHESDNTDHSTDDGDDHVQKEREVDAASAPPAPKEHDTDDRVESPPSQASPGGWGFTAMSAIKSVVSKPFEFFGSSFAGTSTADNQNPYVSPSKGPATPTPASRRGRGFWNKNKSPSANQKGKMKAPILDDSKIDEFQTHAQKMKGKQRENAAASMENDDLHHIQSPNKEGTFRVPEPSDDDSDDDDEEGNQYTNPTQHYQPVQNLNLVHDPFVDTSENPNRAIPKGSINPNLDFSFVQPLSREERRARLDAEVAEVRANQAEQKRLERERETEESLNRHRNVKKDPEAYRAWLDGIPLYMDSKFHFTFVSEYSSYYWLAMAAMNEQNFPRGKDYQVSDEDKEHLAIWNARRGRVGRFQLEAEAAAKEVADREAAKEAAAQEEIAREAAREASAREETEKKAAAQKVVAEKEVAEKEVAKETRVLNVINSNYDFVISDRVASFGKAPQQKWANLALLL